MKVLNKSVMFFDLIFGKNYVYNVIVTIPMLIIISGCSAYLVDNISNMQKSTEASYVIAAMSIYFLQYWVFALQKNRFHDLVNELQCIIDGSETIAKFTLTVYLIFCICCLLF